jgi:sugar/nucleoside kinase (ribokinase family)
MQVKGRCDPLGPLDLEDFPESLAVHIGLVLDDFPEGLALRLAHRDSVLSLEAQGYTRKLDQSGNVSQRKWNNASLLRSLEVMKASRSELRAMGVQQMTPRKLAKLGPRIILVTKGAKGTALWSREEGLFEIPAYQTRIRDPTGAGDALVGGFLVSWIRTGDLLWSCAVGSAIASFVVEDFGPSKFGSSKQIKMRAEKILDETKRIRTGK